jgi:hypothetical protein
VEPTLGRGDIVAVDPKYDERDIREEIGIGLLVPISGTNATDRHEEKNARAPDKHRVSLCPSAQEWGERVVIIKESVRRPDQPTCWR